MDRPGPDGHRARIRRIKVKVLVLNGSCRAGGTTEELARAFMDGAAERGAEVEMITLRDQSIAYCTNCLKCYSYAGDGIAPCSLRDDMDKIIHRLEDADGILFASPVHNGFVTGLMTVFWERLSWRAARPGGPFLNTMSIISRMDDKVRAFGSIANAGGMPERLRRFCDDGTPWLKSNAPLILHGQWVGDIYIGADLIRRPENENDWLRLFFLRRLSARQKQRARELGIRMAEAIRSGHLKPVTMENMVPPVLRGLLERVFAVSPPHRLSGPSDL